MRASLDGIWSRKNAIFMGKTFSDTPSDGNFDGEND
jgi:hypothetical protein